MTLLRTPPSGLTDISQILDFAQENHEALNNYYSKEKLLQKYNSDEFLVIVNYLDFFRDMKHVAEGVGEGNNVCAEYYLQNFKDNFFAIIKEADSIRGKIVNEDILRLCDYFIGHYDCLERMVLFMADKIPKKGFMTNCEMVVDEIAQEASDIQMKASNACDSTEDVGLHSLEKDHGYGAAQNERRKRKNGGGGKEDRRSMSQRLSATPTQPSPDNRTNNPAIDPARQPSENQKLGLAGVVTQDEDPRESPETSQAREIVEKTLEKIKRLYPNSNGNEITLETLNSIRNESNSSEAHFGDGRAGTRRNGPGTSRPSDSQRSRGGASLTEGVPLRTLEDSLKHFGFSERLEDLEKSLEEMRRGQKTEEEHQDECKKLDKELQLLSRKCHPDSVMREGGSQEEVTRAKEMQTALNATRTVLKTLSRIFIEDKDIDHRYSFFTRLQLGLLGNEDQVEDHVYQVLFKISLVSEIKQTIVISEIRNILANGPRCIAAYLEDNAPTFTYFRDIVVFHLGRCVAGYKKLHCELKEVVSECEEEQLHNILPTLTEMKSDCGHQLRHFEKLLKLSKRSFGDLFPMYGSDFPVDEYYVLPVISYLNVIFACSAMIGTSANNNAMFSRIQSAKNSFCSWWSKLPYGTDSDENDDHNTVDPKFEYAMADSQFGHYNDSQFGHTTGDHHFEQTTTKRQFRHPTVDSTLHSREVDTCIKEGGGEIADKIERLYELALAFRGDKLCKAEIKKKYLWRHMDKSVVEITFRDLLTDVQRDLESAFRIENYVEGGGTNRHILKACKEMMAEFRQKASEVVKGLEEINKQNERGRQQLEQVQKMNEALDNQIRECRESNKLFFSQIKELQTKRSQNPRINLA